MSFSPGFLSKNNFCYLDLLECWKSYAKLGDETQLFIELFNSIFVSFVELDTDLNASSGMLLRWLIIGYKYLLALLHIKATIIIHLIMPIIAYWIFNKN